MIPAFREAAAEAPGRQRATAPTEERHRSGRSPSAGGGDTSPGSTARRPGIENLETGSPAVPGPPTGRARLISPAAEASGIPSPRGREGIGVGAGHGGIGDCPDGTAGGGGSLARPCTSEDKPSLAEYWGVWEPRETRTADKGDRDGTAQVDVDARAPKT